MSVYVCAMAVIAIKNSKEIIIYKLFLINYVLLIIQLYLFKILKNYNYFIIFNKVSSLNNLIDYNFTEI